MKASSPLITLVLLMLFPSTTLAAEQLLPRTIIALYDKTEEESIPFSQLHRLAEMPLNHLGLQLEYHDINEPLPAIAQREDVRGVITWFPPGTSMKAPLDYLKWAIKVVDSGKKFVLLGNPGFDENKDQQATSIRAINRFLRKLGLRDKGNWIDLTYDVEFVYKDLDIIEFERTYAGFKPPFIQLVPINDKVTSHLIVRKGNDSEGVSHLIVTGSDGGYIAENYAYYYDNEGKNKIRQWYVNPLKFFRLAFATNDLPKPDTTTIAGRRIYYSHIDGDGWNNKTQIEQYRKNPILSAAVILQRVISTYSDLPVTVAPIAADLDPKWAGNKDSQKVATALFKLGNVELGSHTYSHPFFWQFFADGNVEKERPYLNRYRQSWDKEGFSGWASSYFKKFTTAKKPPVDARSNDHYIPRAYAKEPFDINKEINGSIKMIEALAPQGKKVKIMMWSGDTTPFGEALALTRKQNIRNINGGDSRFDRKYSSLAWVAPIGRQVDGQQQIYASNSNENTYTDLWTGKFHGFKYLVHTIENTESPKRLKPFNIYYHMYSGEREASLKALLDNLDYARTQNITPITASNFAAIADGFYTTKLIKLGKKTWRVENRDKLQTIRFDHTLFDRVDFARSTGIVGQKHYQGSLYIYLDESVTSPVITIKSHEKYFRTPHENIPYLIESRWKIWNLKRSGQKFSFTAQGFGKGEMIWQIPNGHYIMELGKKKTKYIVSDRHLHIRIDDNATTPINLSVYPDA